ncbi:MAG: ferritin-like domain-containing protein [Actinomycetota bacterium]|nr:ferritin-like domain-containing protein [Actinomycetota bacterium]
MLEGSFSRRGLLVALSAGAGSLVACRRQPHVAARPPAARPDPDAGPAETARADEQALLALYDATLATHPVLSAQLTPIREHHQRHLQALPATGAGPSPSATAQSPFPAPVPSPGAPVVRPDPVAAVRALVEAENAAALRRAADCLVVARALAGVLASIAASEAAHAVALTRR